MDTLFGALFDKYPLPAGFALADTFVDQVTVGGLQLSLAGLAARGANGLATGSAASRAESPHERAFFELHERCALLEVRQHKPSLPLCTRAGEARGVAGYGEIFPESDNPEQAFSLSNGVAIGPSFEFACERAVRELVERDGVLGSWYGLDDLLVEPCPDDEAASALAEWYDFQFRTVARSGYQVGLALGLPKSDQAPLLLGFAARRTPQQAVGAALDEALQRLGFLWGEPLPNQEPEFSPTASYHQECSLLPAARAQIKRWFNGEHRSHRGVVERGAEGEALFADLTPAHLEGSLWVIKALQPAALPLVFGRGYPNSNVPEPLLVHPIA